MKERSPFPPHSICWNGKTVPQLQHLASGHQGYPIRPKFLLLPPGAAKEAGVQREELAQHLPLMTKKRGSQQHHIVCEDWVDRRGHRPHTSPCYPHLNSLHNPLDSAGPS